MPLFEYALPVGVYWSPDAPAGSSVVFDAGRGAALPTPAVTALAVNRFREFTAARFAPP